MIQPWFRSADLSLTKRLLGELIAGSVVSYEIAATNLGPSPTGGDLIITDVLPSGLTFVDAIGVGFTCSAAAQTVTCRTDGSVSVGKVVTVTIRARVTSAGGQTIANTARVGTAQNPGDSPSAADLVTTNNDATATATVTVPSMPGTGSSGLGYLVTIALSLIALGILALVPSRRRRSLRVG